MKVALLGASDEFQETLGDLPEGVDFQAKIGKETALVIWFVRSRRELDDLPLIDASSICIISSETIQSLQG